MPSFFYCYRPSRRDEGRFDRWIAAQADDVIRVCDTNPARPVLARVLGEVRAGAVTKVAVSRLDDLDLTAADLNTLLDEFGRLGVALVCVNDPIDPMTTEGRRMALFLAKAAEDRRRHRAERQQDGFARARATGRRWGGRRVGCRIRLTAEKEQRIKELHAAGKSAAEIAASLRLSIRTIFRVLSTKGGE